jgi:hypothetical protein
MPTSPNLSNVQVKISRIGAVILSLSSIFIPFHLNTLVTSCLINFYEVEESSSSSSSYSNSYSSYSDSSYVSSSSDEISSSSSEGVSLLKGLVIVSVLNFCAFLVALGSFDPHREAIYAELEDMKHYQTTKHHLQLITPKANKSFRPTISSGDRPPPPLLRPSFRCADNINNNGFGGQHPEGQWRCDKNQINTREHSSLL